MYSGITKSDLIMYLCVSLVVKFVYLLLIQTNDALVQL